MLGSTELVDGSLDKKPNEKWGDSGGEEGEGMDSVLLQYTATAWDGTIGKAC